MGVGYGNGSPFQWESTVWGLVRGAAEIESQPRSTPVMRPSQYCRCRAHTYTHALGKLTLRKLTTTGD